MSLAPPRPLPPLPPRSPACVRRVRGGRDVAVARRRRGAVRLRRRRRARLGRALGRRAVPPAAAPRARAGRRRAPGHARARHRLVSVAPACPRPPRPASRSLCPQHQRRGAHLRHAQDGRDGDAAGAGAAGRHRRAPAVQPHRLRLRQPVHQHLRPQGHPAQHHQVPRRFHGRSHRTGLMPHLPSAQVLSELNICTFILVQSSIIFIFQG